MLDTFDFPAIPSVNKQLVTELARGEYIQRRENVIAIGNSEEAHDNLREALELVSNDDRSSLGRNSRITRTLGAGTYTIVATTYDPSATGSYTLEVSGHR